MSPSSLLPPLVEPGPPLTSAERQRYSRHLLIPNVGEGGQRRLANAKVLVLGAGGLGSPALMYLAAAGVGTLGVVDFDTVEQSNLQRQVIHTDADVGRPKTASAVAAVARVNPTVTTVAHEVRLGPDNVRDIFSQYDVVLDGTDNFATRYLVNDACALAGMPYVWGSILRFAGQVSVFWAGHGPQYRDLYPTPPPPGSVPSCAEGGVLGVLCATVGSIMATEAIKLICGIGRTLLGRVLTYDALEMTYRTIELRADPAGAVIDRLPADDVESCPAPAAPADAAITPRQLERALDDRGDDARGLCLVDVREASEHALVSIPGDVLIPRGDVMTGAAIDRLPHDRPVVLYCKSGGRSLECLTVLRQAGMTNVRHLDGGILAWIDDVAPHLPRY